MNRILLVFLLAIVTVSCKGDKSTKDFNSENERSVKKEEPKDTLSDLIKVENPEPGELISSPLEIKGEARGYWFFEAEASAELLDENLQQISKTNTTAIGEWMTEDWVQFSGIMTFDKPSTKKGFLVLHKANASGLKEHEMNDTIKVKFRSEN